MNADGASRLAPGEVDGYLSHLGVFEAGRHPEPDPATLRILHWAYLRAIPFENASVLRGEPIELDPPQLLAKFVDRGRGGFCYELNGDFVALLEALGFAVERPGPGSSTAPSWVATRSSLPSCRDRRRAVAGGRRVRPLLRGAHSLRRRRRTGRSP